MGSWLFLEFAASCVGWFCLVCAFGLVGYLYLVMLVWRSMDLLAGLLRLRLWVAAGLCCCLWVCCLLVVGCIALGCCAWWFEFLFVVVLVLTTSDCVVIASVYWRFGVGLDFGCYYGC